MTPLVSLDNIEKKSLTPWNNQRCYQETGDVKFKENSTFVMDKIACMMSNLSTAISGGAGDDTVKNVLSFFPKANKANPVATLPLSPSKVIGIDIANRSFDHAIRVKVSLETGTGDVDRYIVVDVDEYTHATFNSDTIKAIEMDVLSSPINDQATAGSALEAASVTVFNASSFPVDTDVVAKINVINA